MRKLLAGAICLSFVTFVEVLAAPVTLQFEAEIVRVLDTVPFDAGVSFDVGDTITGQFSFVPDEIGGGSESGQPNSFESQQTTRAFINVNGVEFQTPDTTGRFLIRTFNNSLSTLHGETDKLRVGSFLAPSNPSEAPNVSPSLSSFGIVIEGRSNVLDGAIIPADVAIWNELIEFSRSLKVRLDSDSGGAIGFNAALNPGSFVRVPEPSTRSLLLLLLPSLLCGYRKRKNSSTTYLQSCVLHSPKDVTT